MGIDRIGKGGAPPSPEIGGAEKASKTGAVDKPFSVERADRTKETAAVDATSAASATSPLAQLKSGAIDVERYLDLRVDEATKTLDGLPAGELAEIKKMLRDQLATDPGLVDLVKTATGKIPNPPENE